MLSIYIREHISTDNCHKMTGVKSERIKNRGDQSLSYEGNEAGNDHAESWSVSRSCTVRDHQAGIAAVT